MYGASLQALLASDEVDAVVPVLLQRSATSPQVTERVIAEVKAARAAGSRKPVHVCWVAPQEADGNRARLLDAGIACHAWPARTAQMLALTTKPPAARMSRVHTEMTRPSDVPVQGGWLGSARVFNLLDDAGIPVACWALAGSREEAIATAERLGARVVMKAERPDLIHKSDAGGVAVGLDTAERVAAAYDDMARRLGTTEVLVQQQASAGLELFVGARRDKSFGPIVMVGLGGIWVEALKDVALRLAPVGAAGAHAMLEELKGYALLAGSRGHPGADIAALSELVARLSAFVAAADWIEELDINPVIANGDGLVAVDARVRARPLQAAFGSERSE
jgi:acetyltransferase